MDQDSTPLPALNLETPAAEPAAPVDPPDPPRVERREQLFEDSESQIDDGLLRANWAVPWSDLMMTMFVLFAVLLALQTMQNRARQPVPQPARPQVEQQERQQVQERPVDRDKPVEREKPVDRDKPTPQEFPVRHPEIEPPVQINVFARSQQAVRETNLQNAEIVLMDDQSVKVSVQGPMFFALGKADLRPEAMRFLDQLAQIIKQTSYEIHVVGHTDDLPIKTAMFPSNWELSLVRASHVARYLIKSGDLAPTRFLVMGRGEYDPAAANAGEQSRALNRRVEIIITRTVTDTEKAKRP